MNGYVLEVNNISKVFPGVKALDKVDFKLEKGEIHALIGENGAGKSTLMHVLAGIHQPDEGTIKVSDQVVKINNPYIAARYGIGVVFQELSLVDKLTIAENIFVNRQPLTSSGLVDKKKLYQKTRELLELFNLDFTPDTLVKKLSTGDQQLIEILKALSQEPDVLILDEPTSSLSQEESERLFGIIRDLKKDNISIIYISHRLQEIFELCDRVTVLRDGKHVGRRVVEETCEDELVKMMVGREVVNIYGTQQTNPGNEYFRVQEFNSPLGLNNISFSLKRGEIVGIFGLVGAGRTELGQAIFGLDPAAEGELYLNGEKISINNPRQAINQGIAYLTEDRKNKGLFLDSTVKENVIAADLNRFSEGPLKFLKDKKIRQFAGDLVDKFRIVTPSIFSRVKKLSGGNQQKTLLANWMGIEPEVLIVDEPTRGVDVGAKSEIYDYLRELVSDRVGIIVLSSDLPEIIGISDRILVMREGRLVDELKRGEATEENVIASAAGVTSNIG